MHIRTFFISAVCAGACLIGVGIFFIFALVSGISSRPPQSAKIGGTSDTASARPAHGTTGTSIVPVIRYREPLFTPNAGLGVLEPVHAPDEPAGARVSPFSSSAGGGAFSSPVSLFTSSDASARATATEGISFLESVSGISFSGWTTLSSRRVSFDDIRRQLIGDGLMRDSDFKTLETADDMQAFMGLFWDDQARRGDISSADAERQKALFASFFRE